MVPHQEFADVSSGFPTVVPSTAPGGDWDQALSLEDMGRKRTGRCFFGPWKVSILME